MHNNTEPRQKLMLTLGDGGCYFLSIVHIAEDLLQRRLDAVVLFIEAIDRKYCRENCYILKPDALISMIYDDREWLVRKEGPFYLCENNEFEVLRFEWPTPAKIYSHFVVGDGKGHIHWDPLGDSNTVRNGELVSKRIFRYA
jgi:hypothetical protein